MAHVESNQDLEALLEYLKANRGFDFTGYKRQSLARRISKQMGELKIEAYADYVDYLEVHPEEFALLFNTILINVTAFFRDPDAWDYFREEIAPPMIARAAPNNPIRVWSAGCASGEEAYTVAMVLAEALGEKGFRDRVKIYATDVDEEALGHARHAEYSAKALESIPPELREKYFEYTRGAYFFRPDLRRCVVYGRHDLVRDAPISRMDLVLCRNTLMYFNAETQHSIVKRLHYALNDGGVLFLGRAEMLLHSDAFTPLDLKHRVFVKAPREGAQRRYFEIGEGQARPSAPEAEAQSRLCDHAFDAVPLAAIAVDTKGTLAMISRTARSLFALGEPDLGKPIKDLEISYRPVDLRSPLDKVFSEQVAVTLREIQCVLAPNTVQFFDVQLSPIFDERLRLLGATITFDDVTSACNLQKEIERISQERETANEELQSANEELETTNEELQSTVEELQTTNEELESSNEEMETMNEELQSTNEELRAANNELRERTAELDGMNDFLESILSSVNMGIAVVDKDLRISLWSSRSEDMWGLKADEAVGKSLGEIDIGLPMDSLREPLGAFLSGDSGALFEPMTVEAVNRRGKPIRCEVKCTMRQKPAGTSRSAVLLMEETKP